MSGRIPGPRVIASCPHCTTPVEKVLLFFSQVSYSCPSCKRFGPWTERARISISKRDAKTS